MTENYLDALMDLALAAERRRNASCPVGTLVPAAEFRRSVTRGAHVGLHPATIDMLEIEPCIYEIVDFRGGGCALSVCVAPVADPREVPGGVDRAKAVWIFSDEVYAVYTDSGRVIVNRSNYDNTKQ